MVTKVTKTLKILEKSRFAYVTFESYKGGMSVKESEIERFFVKECKKKGWLCLKFVSPSMSGLPDRIILAPKGRVFFAELKAPGKKPRRLQESVHKILFRFGFYICVIDSKEQASSYIAAFDLLGGGADEVYTP
ncbi:VRR-NUC domain-containing protein [Anaerotignum faecicola]|jgi:hypothetical protein